jgi:acetyl-CoA synthetase
VDLEGAFTAERAVWLMREFRVTLTLLPATALRAAGLEPAGFAYRAICSGGEALGADLLAWSEEFFGATVDKGYGQTELNACIGNCASVYPIKPESLGRAPPGTTAVLDDHGTRHRPGRRARDRPQPPAHDAGVLAQPRGPRRSSAATGCSPGTCAARTPTATSGSSPAWTT